MRRSSVTARVFSLLRSVAGAPNVDSLHLASHLDAFPLLLLSASFVRAIFRYCTIPHIGFSCILLTFDQHFANSLFVANKTP